MNETFGFSATPFTKDLDPQALFSAPAYQEALARLLHTARHRRFMLLTGDVGAGKSTLLRALGHRLDQTAYELIYIADTQMTPSSFYHQLLEALRVEVPHLVGKARRVAQESLLERFRHRRTPVLLIDEGQTLSPAALEAIRGLTILEFDALSPFALVLVGGPELVRRLRITSFEALAQRIDLRYHLGPLAQDESATYIRHHLRVAGAEGEIFTDEALRRLHQLTGGIPRRLNHAAYTCLLAAAKNGRRLIDDGWVDQLISEFDGTDPSHAQTHWHIA